MLVFSHFSKIYVRKGHSKSLSKILLEIHGLIAFVIAAGTDCYERGKTLIYQHVPSSYER